MSEAVDSQALTPREVAESDRVTLRLAASEVAEAYQLDYFREYPASRHSKPSVSESERARAWHKTETSFPQFAERIAALGGSIPGSQEAREHNDFNLSRILVEVVNPLAREFLLNIVMIRLGSGVNSYVPFDQFKQTGEGEVKRMSDNLRENGFDLTSLTPTDVAEAYLAGHL